ncbi:MAG: peptidylprolyl isomerase [Oscillospiraceae bacterium]|nr:peptidylprolyl isomerase [Oscillospiraceae bacterium]
MNSLKKLFALMLVLVMALTVFTACGDSDADNDGVNNENVENNDSAEPVELGLYINGEKVLGASDTIMTINGFEIPFDEYRYMYKYIDSVSFSGGDATYWAGNEAALPALKSYAEQYILEANWGNLMAKEYGVTLTDEDLSTIETYMAEQVASFASEEEYQATLEETGFTEELLRRLITQEIVCYRVYQDLYASEGAPLAPTDDEIRETLLNDYRRVHHVLISFDHFANLEGYEEATEEELKQAALDYANEILTQIQNGEADVFELSQTVGDDPGMLENEEGYFFTYGTMVKEFEDSSFSLEVGEISGLVETSYGYHIIQRLEHDAYIVANSETCKETVISDKFNSDINELLENAEITFNENYELMTVDSVR